MKKFLQILSAVIVSVGFIGSVANAQASNTVDAEDCDNIVVVNSGSGNDTTFRCADELNLKVVCVNNVYVLNASSQSALSGAAVVTGNQGSGNAVSGTVENSNDTTTHVVGSSCGEKPEVPETPGGGNNGGNGGNNGGGGAGGVGAAAAKQPVAALPFTASNDTATVAIAGVAGTAIVLAVSRLAVMAYRRSNLK